MDRIIFDIDVKKAAFLKSPASYNSDGISRNK